jgi:hypothetical protein
MSMQLAMDLQRPEELAIAHCALRPDAEVIVRHGQRRCDAATPRPHDRAKHGGEGSPIQHTLALQGCTLLA